MLMSSAEFRESLRAHRPRVFVDGDRVESVADEQRLAPGIAAIGVTYDFARRPELRPLMTATDHATGRTVNRMLHVNRETRDLMSKLEAVRLLCQEVGCAQRYLTHDALNGIHQSTFRTDAEHGTDYHARFLAYARSVQEHDLTLAVAMTDGKGDRSRKPHEQANADAYVHIVERRPGGIVISGVKAIVTAAPYVHGFLVMPCR
ncbi:MAG TPA: 4-hydroxyphenylacetate 3-hydroxylase N-terminal domain-containing protein, partial [Acetobacteraceae bacterium]|nr:4-hydroxyphenylacetate 3-hydroxylase N-terminal domain-containing protein [Acetobacteraceae bacterium]